MQRLVGRERELSMLEAAVEALSERRGAFLRLVGEPGAGKSRLADVLAERAAEHGVTVAWARAWERTSALPYGIVLDALQSVRRQGADVQIEAALSALALGATQSRSAVFDAVAHAFAERTTPTLVVLDDLHAADLDSLELLTVVTPGLRASRTLIVATQRSTETGASPEASHLLDELARVSTSLEVNGFDVAAVAALIREIRGSDSDWRTAEAIHRATLGNPLFVDGVVRAALRDGTLDDGTINAPADVRRIIAQRVARLGPGAAEVLESAAAIGRPFALALLTQVLGARTLGGNTELGQLVEPSREALLAILEVAVEEQLLIRDQAGLYFFRHTLVGDALTLKLASAERARLHKEVAAGLQRFEGDQASPPEVAEHLVKAVSLVGLEVALAAVERAAHHATTLRAHEEAVRHRRTAALLVKEHRASDRALRLRAELALGKAWLLAGKRGHARDALLEATRLARDGADAVSFAEAALGIADTGEFGGLDREKLGLLEESVTLLGATPSELKLRVLARLVSELWVDAAAFQRRLDLSKDLLDVARSLGSSDALGDALAARFQALWGPDGRDERRVILEELERLTRGALDPERLLTLHRHALLVAIEHGDIAAFAAEADNMAKLGERLKRPQLDETVAQRRLSLALLRGDLAEASEWLERCRVLGESIQNPQYEMGYQLSHSLLAVDAGRLDDLASIALALEKDALRLPHLPFVRARVANLHALLGNAAAAQRHLDAVVQDALPRLNQDLVMLACLVFLAETAWLLDDGRAGDAIQAKLEPYSDHTAAVGSTLCLGSVSYYLGLLALLRGDTGAALEHLERAHARHLAMASPPWIARTANELARVLRERNEARDGPRVRQLEAQVQHIARTGIQPLARASRPSDARPQIAPPRSIPEAPPRARLEREGQIWVLEFGGVTVRLKDMKGLRLLATLLFEPTREHHVLELMGAADLRGRESDSPPLLDQTARLTYRERLAELRLLESTAEAHGESARLFALRAEREALEDQLNQAFGLGGRARATGTAERARVAVAKAFERTLGVLESQHPPAFAHFTHSLRTGLFCAYDPDPTLGATWTVVP